LSREKGRGGGGGRGGVDACGRKGSMALHIHCCVLMRTLTTRARRLRTNMYVPARENAHIQSTLKPHIQTAYVNTTLHPRSIHPCPHPFTPGTHHANNTHHTTNTHTLAAFLASRRLYRHMSTRAWHGSTDHATEIHGGVALTDGLAKGLDQPRDIVDFRCHRSHAVVPVPHRRGREVHEK